MSPVVLIVPLPALIDVPVISPAVKLPVVLIVPLPALIDVPVIPPAVKLPVVLIVPLPALTDVPVIPAAVKGIRTVDAQLKKIVTEILKRDGTILVTADHGNADQMYDFKKKQIIKEHSLNPVPFIAVNRELVSKKAKKINLSKLKVSGSLADIAPTVLKIMDIKKPKEMTGHSLI
jgi:hypothetical protein